MENKFFEYEGERKAEKIVEFLFDKAKNVINNKLNEEILHLIVVPAVHIRSGVCPECACHTSGFQSCPSDKDVPVEYVSTLQQCPSDSPQSTGSHH